MYPVIWTDNLPTWQGGVANGLVILTTKET